MSRTRQVILALTFLVMTIVPLGLCRWQLHRLATRKALNATLIAARALPPFDVNRALQAHTPLDGRRIRVHGSFDIHDQVLLRGRVQNEAPGLQVVTPFIVDSTGIVLWVVRGFVASPDAVTPPDTIRAPIAGPVTIEGVAMAIPNSPDRGQPLLRGHTTTWARLDSATLERRRPGSLDVYLLLDDDSSGPGRLAPVPPPTLDNGPHLSYAIQWFGIALAIASFGVMVLRRGGRGPSRRLEAP